MKRYVIRILGVTGALLALVFAWMWLGFDGKPRNVHWLPPEPHKPDFASMVPTLPQQDPADLNRFVATLERPLFSPNRRPPPPPPPPVVAAPPPPPDPLASIHLFGVFSGEEGTGGIIARIDGKPKRVMVEQKIGAWTVKSIDNRDVTLVRGAETRVLKLVHARAPASVAAAPDGRAAAAAAAAPPAVPAEGVAPPPSAGGADFVNDRKARRNAARAKAGLPPLP